jgi:DNA-binding MarR family transcriptional regulator
MARMAYDPVEASRQFWIGQGWQHSAEGVAAVVAVMRGWQILLTRANQLLRPLGLTFARYQVLGLLRPGERLPLGEVGARLWITPGTVTSSIDRLESAGLVRRVPHAVDGRTVLAEITGEGRRVFDESVATLNAHLFSSLPLSRTELSHLTRLMNKLRAEVGDIVG